MRRVHDTDSFVVTLEVSGKGNGDTLMHFIRGLEGISKYPDTLTRPTTLPRLHCIR